MNVFLLVGLAVLAAEIQYTTCDRFYILTSSSNDCPGQFTGEPCLTLQQFASSPGRSSTVSLKMEPGSHALSSELSLSSIRNFTMSPLNRDGNVRIVCGDGLSGVAGKFLLNTISYVQLQGVSFENCRDNKFGTNGNSVLFTDVSFTNGGLTVRNMSNIVQFYNVSFSNSDTTTIEAVQTTRIRMRDITFSGGKRVVIGPAAEFSIENSIFERGSNSPLLLTGISRATVVGCQFYSNVHIYEAFAENRGGAMIITRSNVSITDNIFDGGSASSGGAIYIFYSNVTVDNSNFTGNSASTYGSVYVRGSNFTVMNSSFSNNRAERGAAISVTEYTWLQIIACSFTNNIASDVSLGGYGSGGAIFISSHRATSIQSSSFFNNRAGAGGAIASEDGNTYTVSDCYFSSNIASQRTGGAISLSFAFLLTVVRSSFDGNSASTFGGAIYTNGMFITELSNFTNNGALDSAGAVYIRGDYSTVFVGHGYFKNNTEFWKWRGIIRCWGVLKCFSYQ